MERRPCISVFGSSLPLGEVAVELGRTLARAGFSIACGGYGGSMEELSRGASEEGAPVTGVLFRPFGLQGNPYLSETILTERLIARIERLVELGQGYVILPGGAGTLSEMALAYEHVLRGLLPARPLVLLTDHWAPLVDVLDRSPPARALAGQKGPGRASQILERVQTPQQAARLLSERLRPRAPPPKDSPKGR